MPRSSSLVRILLTWLAGVLGLYGLLSAIGYVVVCRWDIAAVLCVVSALSATAYFKLYDTLEHSEIPTDDTA